MPDIQDLGLGINITRVKLVDQTKNDSDNTLIIDDELIIDSLPGGVYAFDMMLLVVGDPTPDFKYKLVSDATLSGFKLSGDWTSATASTFVNITDISIQINVFMPDTTQRAILVKGFIELSAKGTLNLQWAPAGIQSPGATVKKGSWMTVKSTGSVGV